MHTPISGSEKIKFIFASALLASLIIMASVIETWSKNDRNTALAQDSHRLGIVEHIYKEEYSTDGMWQSSALAEVALADKGYGYIGHVTASIPKNLSLSPGQPVEVILKETPSNDSPNLIVRKIKASD